MKKILTTFVIFFLSVVTLWGAWEGNAGTGTDGDFPKGLFVHSDLFPKHTLIEIINIENNAKSRAMVIGPLKIKGLLISLSPDLAKALQIKLGSTVRVRISTPYAVKEIGEDESNFAMGKNIEPPAFIDEPEVLIESVKSNAYLESAGPNPPVVENIPEGIAEATKEVEPTPDPVKEVPEPVEPKSTEDPLIDAVVVVVPSIKNETVASPEVAVEEVTSDTILKPLENIPELNEDPIEETPLALAEISPVIKEKKLDNSYTGKLKRGEYYVQIAVYKDTLNVENVVQNYEKTYPIVVEKIQNNKKENLYRVYVGPIQKDEQGVILARFKEFGFKDAFINRAK